MLGHVSSDWCHSLYFAPWEILNNNFLSLCLRFILWFQLVKNPTRIPCVYVWSIRVGRLFGFLRAQSRNVCVVGVAKSCRPMIHSELGLLVSWDWYSPVCSWLCGPTDTLCLCSLNSGSDSWYQSLNALRFPSNGRCLSLEKYFVVIRKFLNVRVGIMFFYFFPHPPSLFFW